MCTNDVLNSQDAQKLYSMLSRFVGLDTHGIHSPLLVSVEGSQLNSCGRTPNLTHRAWLASIFGQQQRNNKLAHVHLLPVRARFIIALVWFIPSQTPSFSYQNEFDQYHAFETIRVCYPRGFFNESLQALGLSRRRNSGPNGPHDPTVARTDHPSTVGLGSCSRSTKTTTLTPATATATAASGGVLSSQNGTTINRNYGTGGGGTGGVHFLGAGAIGEGVERSGMLVRSKPRLLGPRSRSPPLLRRRGRGVGTPTSAPRLDPMPCAARGRPCPGCDSQDHFDTRRRSGDLSPSRHPIIRPQLSSLRQASSGTVRYPPEEGERNSYWDILGKYRNGTCHGDVRAVVENSEMAESAVASVVLLRWAMEYLKEQERNSSPGGGCRARSFNGKGEAPHSPMENSRSPSVKPKAMNATVSGPVHLMHAARKSKDSDLFLLPHSLESGNERSEDGSTSPRERVNIGFAATNPASLALSSAEKGGGRESDCDPSVSVVSGTFPSLENEPKNTESDLKRYAPQGQGAVFPTRFLSGQFRYPEIRPREEHQEALSCLHSWFAINPFCPSHGIIFLFLARISLKHFR